MGWSFSKGCAASPLEPLCGILRLRKLMIPEHLCSPIPEPNGERHVTSKHALLRYHAVQPLEVLFSIALVHPHSHADPCFLRIHKFLLSIKGQSP